MDQKKLLTAKKKVITAGHQLIKTGLIARTWGNISCRVDDEYFVITPSGRAYDSLTEDEIVAVKIEDVSYDSEIKPSSEKKIHATVYRKKPNIGFVIHTHQINASSLSSFHKNIEIYNLPLQKILGEQISIAGYGLPGTTKLMKNVEQTLENYPKGFAIVMAYHGVVCFGENDKKTFEIALSLEKACQSFLFKECSKEYQKKISSFTSVYKLFLEQKNSNFTLCSSSNLFLNSVKEQDQLIFYRQKKQTATDMYGEQNDKELFRLSLDFQNHREKAEASLKPAQKKIWQSFQKELACHAQIYNSDKKITAIIHTHNPDVLAVSQIRQELFAYLDDFAQIVGVSAKALQEKELWENSKLKSVLKNRSAFFYSFADGKGGGAFAVGRNHNSATAFRDAEASSMVLQKNCRASIASFLLSKSKPINKWESLLMYWVYQLKYSKQAK